MMRKKGPQKDIGSYEMEKVIWKMCLFIAHKLLKNALDMKNYDLFHTPLLWKIPLKGIYGLSEQKGLFFNQNLNLQDDTLINFLYQQHTCWKLEKNEPLDHVQMGAIDRTTQRLLSFPKWHHLELSDRSKKPVDCKEHHHHKKRDLWSQYKSTASQNFT